MLAVTEIFISFTVEMLVSEGNGQCQFESIIFWTEKSLDFIVIKGK